MSTAFGYLGSFGIARESVWGTSPANPEVCVEIEDESMELKQETVETPTLAGFMVQHTLSGHRSVGGAVNFPVSYDSFYQILLATLGTVVTSDLGSSVNSHAFSMNADTNKPGISAYVERGSEQFIYSGLQVSSLKLVQETGEFMKASLEMEGREESLTAFTQPSPTDFSGIAYDDLAMTVGGTAITVKGIEINIDRGLASDRFGLGSRFRQGMGRGSVVKVGGVIKLEFDPAESSDPYGAFRDLTEKAIVMTWTGPVAGGAINKSLTLTFPRAIFQGKTPPLKGQGPIEFELPFNGYASEDGTTGNMTATLVTTDGE